MRSQAGVGHSNQPNAFSAGETAARMALTQSGDAPPVVALVYATVLYQQEEVLRGVRAVLPEIPLVGCSTQGISRLGAVEEVDRVVGVAVIASDTIEAHALHRRHISNDPYEAGLALASALDTSNPNPIFLWYDPLQGTNVEALLKGLDEGGFPLVLGGAAGQPFGPFHQTYQYFGEEVLNDTAIVLQLKHCDIIYDVTNGVEPVGLEFTVTASEENTIKALDDIPAATVWIEQLGGLDSSNVYDLAPWAIGVRPPDEFAALYEGPISLALFNIDSTTGELVVQAPVAPGTRVEICHRTPEAVYDRAIAMAHRLKDLCHERDPFFALSFECGARPRPFLGDELALKELLDMQEILGAELPWLGHYAWGEIAPVGQRSFFHNYTFPLCIFCDAAAP